MLFLRQQRSIRNFSSKYDRGCRDSQLATPPNFIRANLFDFFTTVCSCPGNVPSKIFASSCKTQASSRIIGRGGAFIKQLQRESGCKINTLKDVELRSGLKSRAMNVCGNRTSMSKGLYLIARKIVSRWEYEAEWKGGDPTMPLGQGLPSNNTSASRGGGGGADDMEVDGAASYGRRSRGRRGSNRGNGEASGGGRDRDGGRDGSRGGRRDSDGDVRSGGRDEYARGSSNSYAAAPAVQSPTPGSMPVSSGVPSPWADPSVLASVVGAQAAAAAAAGGPAAVASAESWARLLGQIPRAARESLGIGTAPASGGDIYRQVLTAAQQQQQPQQQAPQVRPRKHLEYPDHRCSKRAMSGSRSGVKPEPLGLTLSVRRCNPSRISVCPSACSKTCTTITVDAHFVHH